MSKNLLEFIGVFEVQFSAVPIKLVRFAHKTPGRFTRRFGNEMGAGASNQLGDISFAVHRITSEEG